jgi:hypothetical protein
MRDKDTISKGPKKRDPACFETQHVIMIPAGTILRQQPGAANTFDCPVGFGKFTIDRSVAEANPDTYRKVIA